MNVIIAGGRDFNVYGKVAWQANNFPLHINEVVCGCAKGADSLGREWAKANNVPYREFPADWEAHGKRAGYLRNIEMAEYSDALLAFWDGKSKGTKNMIDEALKRGLFVKVVMY